MAFDRQAAKQAGYTDEEIDAFLQANPQARKEEQRQPSPAATDTEPPAPTTVIEQPGSTFASVATTAGLAAAPYVLPAAGALAAGVGGSKLYGAWNASAQAAKALADAKMASEQGIANRAAMRMNPQMARPGPASFGPGTSMPTQPYSAPVQGPAVPQSMPAQQPMARQPSMIQRGMDYASRMRQVAAQRVLPVAGAAAGPAAVMGGIAAVPGAMMMDAYGNYKQQTPEERKRSAMEALSGQGMGQAGIY
jgi:hypothetical protein